LTSPEGPRKTPLFEAHVAAGAKMVDFAGWRMPVSYSGVIDEHLAVRTRAGLFDVSHMGEVEIRGPQALEFLQRLTCNNVARLRPGRAHYNALLTPAGTFVDDLLIYALDGGAFMVVLNAGNARKDIDWLREHATAFDVDVADVSDVWALLSIQGPRARETLSPLVEASIDALRYYRFVHATVQGAECIVSRTGYTGEDGFEIYVPVADASRLWGELLARGEEHGVSPVGLGARDTLRLEAKMALYGNDIDETTTVLEADLGWIVKLDKGDFIGRDVLERQTTEGVPSKLVGFEMLGRPIARHGHEVVEGGRGVGRITSGTHSPTLKKNIGLAYLPTDRTEHGTEFDVEIRGRTEKAVVVPTPFYKRAR